MNVLILGASVRAAFASSRRAGLNPRGADLFADADTPFAGSIDRVRAATYPDSLADFARDLEPTPWLYTGALENRPDLVDRISTRHPLLGNPGSVLEAVRDPLEVAEALKEAGLAVVPVRDDPAGLPLNGSWLVKPRASGGGRGIRPWTGEPPLKPASVAYYQRRVSGISLAATFLGRGEATRCLGISRQYVGRPGNRFAYRGSLAPWAVADEVSEQVDRVGRTVAVRFGLLGLFGIDLIFDGRQVWPIEVNPRYSASIETLEWATGKNFLTDHVEVFGFEGPPDWRGTPDAQGFVGKAILHATQPLNFGGVDPDYFDQDLFRLPEIADVPGPGTTFRTGEPVLTVLASGETAEGCRRRLAQRVRAWRRRLADSQGQRFIPWSG